VPANEQDEQEISHSSDDGTGNRDPGTSQHGACNAGWGDRQRAARR
jgi:hypothetical protein